MQRIIEKLIENKKTISTMESCTGGALANAITNIEGSSEVFKFGAVTYSNEFKIKMGVKAEIIDKYSVYSMETATCMSKTISDYTNSDYGIGITGKLNREDVNNKTGEDNIVFVSIYDKISDKFVTQTISVSNTNRIENKDNIIKIIITMLDNIIK